MFRLVSKWVAFFVLASILINEIMTALTTKIDGTPDMGVVWFIWVLLMFTVAMLTAISMVAMLIRAGRQIITKYEEIQETRRRRRDRHLQYLPKNV